MKEEKEKIGTFRKSSIKTDDIKEEVWDWLQRHGYVKLPEDREKKNKISPTIDTTIQETINALIADTDNKGVIEWLKHKQKKWCKE